MSEKTMLDLGGLAFMEGDPLGLRDLEDAITWRPNGPLPDWLDGAEPPDDEEETPPIPMPAALLDELLPSELPDEDDADLDSFMSSNPLEPPEMPATVVIVSPQEPSPAAPSLTAPPLVESPVVETPLAAELIECPHLAPPDDCPVSQNETSPPPPDGVSEALVSINDILRFVDDDPPPAPVATSSPAAAEQPGCSTPLPTPVPAPIPARRVLTFDELIDARLCLLTSVADRLWAIPLDRIAAIAPRDRTGAIDLFESQEGKKRRGAGVAIAFDSDAIVIVDRILGPRSFGWEQVSPDAPDWMLAHVTLAGERVGLLDWEVVSRSAAS